VIGSILTIVGSILSLLVMYFVKKAKDAQQEKERLEREISVREKAEKELVEKYKAAQAELDLKKKASEEFFQ